MSIIKLPNEGDTHTATVKLCESVKGQYGMQVKFDFTNGDTLFMPYDSAMRQLCRAGFDGGDDENGEPVADLEIVGGETLTFARTHNKKPGAKPFWDVSIASGAEKQGVKPSKRLPSPATPAKPASSTFDDAVPLDGPPAHHREVPLPESPDGELFDPPTMRTGIAEKRELIESAYQWAYDASARIQWETYYTALKGEPKSMQDTPHRPSADSIQAGAATLLIQAEKRGAI